MVESDSGPRNITTDHATIKEWVETRGGTPARITGQPEGASSLYVVRKDEPMEGMEAVPWDEFFEMFEDEELAFIYADQEPAASDEWFYDLVDRSEIVERADLDSAEVEQSLLEGEVVESEITETTVIEKTVVETDQIESQIVDSEIIETNLLDHEVQKRELVGASFDGSTVTTSLAADTGTARATEPEAGESTRRIESRDEPRAADDEGTLTDDDDGGLLSDDDERSRSDTESYDDEKSRSDTESHDDERPRNDNEGVFGRHDSVYDENVADSSHDEHADDTSHDDRSAVSDAERSRSDEATPAQSPVGRSSDSPAGLGIDEHVTLNVRDSVRTTTEVFDRKTVESRVVDREITESGTLESDDIDIDLEGIEETILESDLIKGELADATADSTSRETVPSGAITSERTEGDVVRSEFVERRVVETDSTEHRQLTCSIADSQLVEAVDGRSHIVQRAIVDRDAGEEALLQQPTASTETSAATSEQAPTADAETGAMAAGEAGETETMGSDEQHHQPTEDEIGKTVISGDKEVGLVSDVQGDTLHVEADPSLTDKIKAAFEWGDVDEETYPVEAEEIESISDDAVHIREV